MHDIVLISDADEIPRAKGVKLLSRCYGPEISFPVFFELSNHMFTFNHRYVDAQTFKGSLSYHTYRMTGTKIRGILVQKLCWQDSSEVRLHRSTFEDYSAMKRAPSFRMAVGTARTF